MGDALYEVELHEGPYTATERVWVDEDTERDVVVARAWAQLRRRTGSGLAMAATWARVRLIGGGDG